MWSARFAAGFWLAWAVFTLLTASPIIYRPLWVAGSYISIALALWLLVQVPLRRAARWLPDMLVVASRGSVVSLPLLIPGSEPWLEADATARQLLKEVLTPDECARVGSRTFFSIPSRLYKGWEYLVPGPRVYGQGTIVLRDERLQTQLIMCVQPTTMLPPADRMLVHKLWIEADEDGYLGRANKWDPLTRLHVAPDYRPRQAVLA